MEKKLKNGDVVYDTYRNSIMFHTLVDKLEYAVIMNHITVEDLSQVVVVVAEKLKTRELQGEIVKDNNNYYEVNVDRENERVKINDE